MILRVPGNAVLLRAAPTERDDFPAETYWGTPVSFANDSDSDLLTFERSGLSKTAQFEPSAVFAGRFNAVLRD